jgi:DNA-binding Lrp family transcriptional regulator
VKRHHGGAAPFRPIAEKVDVSSNAHRERCKEMEEMLIILDFPALLDKEARRQYERN